MLSVGMEAATVGVKVETGGMGGVCRKMVYCHPYSVTLRNVDGNALSLIEAQTVVYLAVLI